MNKKLLPALMAMSLSAGAYAEPEIFGLMHVVLQHAEESTDGGDTSEDVLEMVSNYSRLGVRGGEKLENGMEVIYHYELAIYPDDNTTWTKRNSFLGVQGTYGRLVFGRFDTAFKSSQGKVDVFGDQIGDIMHMITFNDNRLNNMVGYTTPKFGGGVQLHGQMIMREDPELDDGFSGSASFSHGGLYVALAADSDVEDVDTSAYRFTATYKIGRVQLGGLYETFSPPEDADEVDAFLGSVKIRVGENLDLKLQYGESDIKEEGGSSMSAGADYYLTKKFRLTGYVTQNESDEGFEGTYVGAGGVLNF